jgi:hypothetical protein
MGMIAHGTKQPTADLVAALSQLSYASTNMRVVSGRPLAVKISGNSRTCLD